MIFRPCSRVSVYGLLAVIGILSRGCAVQSQTARPRDGGCNWLGRWRNSEIHRPSPPRQKSVGGLSAASPTDSAEPTDAPVAVRRTRRRSNP